VFGTVNENGKPKQTSVPEPPVYTLFMSHVLKVVAPPKSVVLSVKEFPVSKFS
jgi:hypothetical protein